MIKADWNFYLYVDTQSSFPPQNENVTCGFSGPLNLFLKTFPQTVSNPHSGRYFDLEKMEPH